MMDHRRERLKEARQAEGTAYAEMQAAKDGGILSPAGSKWRDAVHNREMAMYLVHDCYGAYGKCISCWCTRGSPCVSHQGSPKHQAELLERIAIAAEARVA